MNVRKWSSLLILLAMLPTFGLACGGDVSASNSGQSSQDKTSGPMVAPDPNNPTRTYARMPLKGIAYCTWVKGQGYQVLRDLSNEGAAPDSLKTQAFTNVLTGVTHSFDVNFKEQGFNQGTTFQIDGDSYTWQLSYDEWDRPNLKSGPTEPVAFLAVDGPNEATRRLFIDALWGIVAKGECAAVPPTGAPGQYVAVEEWDKWLREHRDWAPAFARKYSRGNNGYWSEFFDRYPEWAKAVAAVEQQPELKQPAPKAPSSADEDGKNGQQEAAPRSGTPTADGKAVWTDVATGTKFQMWELWDADRVTFKGGQSMLTAIQANRDLNAVLELESKNKPKGEFEKTADFEKRQAAVKGEMDRLLETQLVILAASERPVSYDADAELLTGHPYALWINPTWWELTTAYKSTVRVWVKAEIPSDARLHCSIKMAPAEAKERMSNVTHVYAVRAQSVKAGRVDGNVSALGFNAEGKDVEIWVLDRVRRERLGVIPLAGCVPGK